MRCCFLCIDCNYHSNIVVFRIGVFVVVCCIDVLCVCIDVLFVCMGVLVFVCSVWFHCFKLRIGVLVWFVFGVLCFVLHVSYRCIPPPQHIGDFDVGDAVVCIGVLDSIARFVLLCLVLVYSW